MSPQRTEGQNGSASVWQGFCTIGRHTPDQTKAVKGQNSKTLVMAGTIKRPLPCPVEGMEKQEIFHEVKKRNRVRKEEKRLERKQREKGKKTKKERRELVRKSMHQ